MNTYLVINVNKEMQAEMKKGVEVALFSDDGTRAVIVSDKAPKGDITATLPGNIASYVQKEHLSSSVLDDLYRKAAVRNASPTERKAAIKGWVTVTLDLEAAEKLVTELARKRSASVAEIALTHGHSPFEVNGKKCFVTARRGATLAVQECRGQGETASPATEEPATGPKAEKPHKNGKATSVSA